MMGAAPARATTCPGRRRFVTGAKSTIRVSVKRLVAARTTLRTARRGASPQALDGRTARRAPPSSAARPASRGARRRRRPWKSRAPRTSLTRPTPSRRPRRHVGAPRDVVSVAQSYASFYGALATRVGSCRLWRCNETPGLVSGEPRRQRREKRAIARLLVCYRPLASAQAPSLVE